MRTRVIVPVKVRREPNQRDLGTVFDQQPQEGEFRKTGTAVTIFVSDGAGTAKVPKVDGLDLPTATERLEAANFEVLPATEQSDTVKLGIVIRTDPVGGAKVDPNTRVTIYVSAGPAPINVPNVAGLSRWI